MNKIVLSTDSTCDLSDELKRRYAVHCIPYHVEYRGSEYVDGVEIVPETIYEGFYEDGSLPKTAAVNVAEYLRYFEGLMEGGGEIVHIGLGGALSSSVENARLASQQLSGVHVIDSCNLSTGMGQLVIRAGRMIEEGVAAGDVVVELERMKGRVHASFVLETLDFMAAGGRCPQVVAHAGSALHLRPEIVVNTDDGSMHVGGLHHGSAKKALREYLKKQVAKNPGILTDDVFVTHSGGVKPGLIDEACACLRELLPSLERIHVTQASCTISSHCGPGTIGFLFVTEEQPKRG